ncbi:basic proline-rich protein-like isoform X2 [Fukomys damarensis]|uniref:basic proline-rich protein-like isoform X2 n=1 Tax=Fukomys damarensis TaxID=885580 RepID=UPI00053F454D|nr:basic proline-rich protein-like isoform X2 [Fukomys damarensis]
MQVNDTPTVTPLELDRAKDPQCHSKALPEAPAPGPAPGGVPEQVPWSWDTSASPPAPARGKRRHQTHGPPSPGKRPQSQDSPKRRQPPHTCLPGTPGLPAAPTALRSPSASIPEPTNPMSSSPAPGAASHRHPPTGSGRRRMWPDPPSGALASRPWQEMGG